METHRGRMALTRAHMTAANHGIEQRSRSGVWLQWGKSRRTLAEGLADSAPSLPMMVGMYNRMWSAVRFSQKQSST